MSRYVFPSSGLEPIAANTLLLNDTGSTALPRAASVADARTMLSAGMRTTIAADEIFTIYENDQAVFVTTINVEGVLNIDGELHQVS